MYIRFVIAQINPHSGARLGLFQAAGRLRRSGVLSTHELDLLTETLDWFNTNLSKPARFSRSRRHNPKAKAISWFKHTAKEHIARIRDLAALLEAHDVHVHPVTTHRPGYIVYEDAFQIAAEPFRDTAT